MNSRVARLLVMTSIVVVSLASWLISSGAALSAESTASLASRVGAPDCLYAPVVGCAYRDASAR